MHDVPSWVVAGLSALISAAAVWGAFRALVQRRLDDLERLVEKLEKRDERHSRYLHTLDKELAVGIAVQARTDEITAKMRRALPPREDEGEK